MENTSKHIDLTNFDIDAFWMGSELEFRHQNENMQFRSSVKNRLTFGEVIKTLFDIEKQDVYQLVINNGGLNVIEDADAIYNYDFLNHHIEDDNGKNHYDNKCSGILGNTVITLSFKTFETSENNFDQSILSRDSLLIVHLQYPKGIKDKACYTQVTFCFPTPLSESQFHGILPQPKSLSLVMGFDLKSQQDNEREFQEVYDSMREKAIADRRNEFTYVESTLFDLVTHPIPARNIYFGQKAYEKNRFLDAILYFEQAYFELQNTYWESEFSEEMFSAMVDCAYKIGFCYQELKLLNKAFRYLEFAANYDKSFIAQSEYINCLVNLKDIRAYHYIESKIKELTLSECKDSDYELFIKFLMRRKCFCLIEFKLFDEAEEELNKILAEDPTNEFAIGELKYINSLRNK